jgi:hypothetical protein
MPAYPTRVSRHSDAAEASTTACDCRRQSGAENAIAETLFHSQRQRRRSHSQPPHDRRRTGAAGCPHSAAPPTPFGACNAHLTVD